MKEGERLLIGCMERIGEHLYYIRNGMRSWIMIVGCKKWKETTLTIELKKKKARKKKLFIMSSKAGESLKKEKENKKLSIDIRKKLFFFKEG